MMLPSAAIILLVIVFTEHACSSGSSLGQVCTTAIICRTMQACSLQVVQQTTGIIVLSGSYSHVQKWHCKLQSTHMSLLQPVTCTIHLVPIRVFDEYMDAASVSTLGIPHCNWLLHGVMLCLHACRGAEAGSQGPPRRQRCPNSVTDWVWQDAGLLASSPVRAAVPSRCIPR